MTHMLRLTGFCDSVYTWVVRLVLAELAVPYTYVEVNPFTPEGQRTVICSGHPFGRVPVLSDGDFEIYETGAITAYLDHKYGDGRLSGQGDKQIARVRQVIGLIDAYTYWPLVRQVFSHGVYRPHIGEAGDQEQVRSGLGTASRVLAELEKLAAETLILNRADMTLADLHLAPMIDYFTMYPDAARMLAQHPALDRWFVWFRSCESFVVTRPDLFGKKEIPQ